MLDTRAAFRVSLFLRVERRSLVRLGSTRIAREPCGRCVVRARPEHARVRGACLLLIHEYVTSYGRPVPATLVIDEKGTASLPSGCIITIEHNFFLSFTSPWTLRSTYWPDRTRRSWRSTSCSPMNYQKLHFFFFSYISFVLPANFNSILKIYSPCLLYFYIFLSGFERF